MPDIPSPLTYATIIGKFSSILADSSDAGSAPDLVPLSGTVTIVPSVRRIFIDGTPPQIAIAQTITATVVDGQILAPDGATGLRVLATDSPGINPVSFQYTATFSLSGAAAQPSPIVFNAPGGTTVDLTVVVPAEVAPAVQTVVSEASRIAAEAAADDAEYWAGVAEEAAGGSFVTDAELTTALADYATTASLGDYVTVTILDDYVPETRTVAGHALSSNITLVKGDVGLGNVDNTADASKPVSTAQAAADAAVQAYSIQRANHTGSQSSSTISDFTEAVQDAVAAFLAQGTNVTLTYDDTGNTLTVASSGGSLDAEAVRDAIGIALVGSGLVSVTVNDAADTITISTTATANDTDANLKARANHTGTQSADTLTDGTTNKAFLATERTKLTGIATAATANDTDANLKSRSNHTGTQAISTVSGLQTAIDDRNPLKILTGGASSSGLANGTVIVRY